MFYNTLELTKLYSTDESNCWDNTRFFTYCSCSGNAVDNLVVSRLIKGTIYREKTEIINTWGSVDSQPLPPKYAPVNALS